MRMFIFIISLLAGIAAASADCDSAMQLGATPTDIIAACGPPKLISRNEQIGLPPQMDFTYDGGAWIEFKGGKAEALSVLSRKP